MADVVADAAALKKALAGKESPLVSRTRLEFRGEEIEVVLSVPWVEPDSLKERPAQA